MRNRIATLLLFSWFFAVGCDEFSVPKHQAKDLPAVHAQKGQLEPLHQESVVSSPSFKSGLFSALTTWLGSGVGGVFVVGGTTCAVWVKRWNDATETERSAQLKTLHAAQRQCFAAAYRLGRIKWVDLWDAALLNPLAMVWVLSIPLLERDKEAFTTAMNAEDKDGFPPLHRLIFDYKGYKVTAAANAKLVISALLAKPEVDVNLLDQHDFTPLGRAIIKGDTEIIQDLLAKPEIDINLKGKERGSDNMDNPRGKDPLELASRYQRFDVVKQLLGRPQLHINENRSVLNCGTYYPGTTIYRDTAIVRQLLARPDITIETKGAVLRCASWYGQLEIVRDLVSIPGIELNEDKWSRVSARFPGSETPLDNALKQEHFDVAKVLLAAPGIDVSKGAPLPIAAEKRRLDIVQALLDKPGIDVNKGNPLHTAVAKGDTEIVEALLKQDGILVNAADGYNHDTPLHRVNDIGGNVSTGETRQTQVRIAALLLARPEIKINIQNDDGYTLLHLAARRNEELVKLLLSQGDINVNIQNKFGETPLHTAVSGICGLPCIGPLLDREDIQVNVKNVAGETPFDYIKRAWYDQREGIRELLLSKGAKPGAEIH